MDEVMAVGEEKGRRNESESEEDDEGRGRIKKLKKPLSILRGGRERGLGRIKL